MEKVQKTMRMTLEELRKAYRGFELTETDGGFRLENRYMRDYPQEIVMLMPKEMPVDGCGWVLNPARWQNDRYNLLLTAFCEQNCGDQEINEGLETELRFVDLRKENDQFVCWPVNPQDAEYVIVRIYWDLRRDPGAYAEEPFEGNNVALAWRWKFPGEPRGFDYYILRLTSGCAAVQELFAKRQARAIELAAQREEEFQVGAKFFAEQFKTELEERANALGWWMDFETLAERGMVRLAVPSEDGVSYYDYRLTAEMLEELQREIARAEVGQSKYRRLPEL